MARQGLLIKYQLQQQMATKDVVRLETMALRITRRSRTLVAKQSSNPEPKSLISQVESKDLNNHIKEHKQQQNSPKNEKQSTSPPNNEPQPIIISDDKSRRVTRSSILISKQICSQGDLQNELITPDDNQISKVSEEVGTKRIIKIASVQSLSQNGYGELPANTKKSIAKLSQNLVSPYSEIRRSYRRIHRNEIISLPYRKCHDAFQGRIVAIINKIEGGKNCLRDFESLVERVQRISGKDMMNRYIIAGIATIIKLCKEKDIYELKLIQRLEVEEQKLRQKIVEEMDRMDAYQQYLLAKNQEFISTKDYKNMLIRKVYKIMKYQGNHRQDLRDMREKAIFDCQQFIGCEVNVANLLTFVKQKADLIRQ